MAKSEFNLTIHEYAPFVDLDSTKMFDLKFCEPEQSPIDAFFKKTEDLHKISKLAYSSKNENLPNLLLLGYISAVESYFREIIRKLILKDEFCKETCQPQQLSYAAAISHAKDMLPEALLEGCSFISKTNIVGSIQRFLGINKLSKEADEVLQKYDTVCQFRHCIIHRFGRLGSQNMIKLGLDKHINCLEKPIKIDQADLQSIFLICTNLVKVINNFLFNQILNRSSKGTHYLWHWDYEKDKSKFSDYYNLFISKINPPLEGLSVDQVYKEFKKVCSKTRK